MRHVLSIKKILPGSSRAQILRLDLAGLDVPFTAGQAMMLGSPHQPDRKPYSISCSPDQARRNGYLEFLIQVNARGGAGSHLDPFAPPALVQLDGPFGAFCLPADLPERRLLFIAGGTGIAPLRSMLWHALERGTCDDIALLYTARTPHEFAYAAELHRLADEAKLRLYQTVTRAAGPSWRGDRGRISPDRLSSVLTTPETLCFVCGPEALVDAVPRMLRDLGVAAERILIEEY